MAAVCRRSSRQIVLVAVWSVMHVFMLCVCVFLHGVSELAVLSSCVSSCCLVFAVTILATAPGTFIPTRSQTTHKSSFSRAPTHIMPKPLKHFIVGFGCSSDVWIAISPGPPPFPPKHAGEELTLSVRRPEHRKISLERTASGLTLRPVIRFSGTGCTCRFMS